MKDASFSAGVSGEEQALAYLTGQGMTCLERRWRAGLGEIDLILRDGDYLVFAEVKYRPAGHAGDGMMAVTRQKRQRMADAALHYLAGHGAMDAPVRFDVVEITADGLRHIPNAFWPDR